MDNKNGNKKADVSNVGEYKVLTTEDSHIQTRGSKDWFPLFVINFRRV